MGRAQMRRSGNYRERRGPPVQEILDHCALSGVGAAAIREDERPHLGDVDALLPLRDEPLHVISTQVMLALDAWIGAEEQPDDITLVLARQS